MNQTGLNRDLGFQTNAAIRARIRELSERPSMDDHDRAVIMLLDDFARCMVLIAALSDANSRRQVGKEPCGECHIQPGETCDICGASWRIDELEHARAGGR